jgi:polyhydroxyalkanoate synthesis regulator phasin
MDQPDDPGELPGMFVETYLDREAGVRTLLDDLERQALEGDHEGVRDRIRQLAEEQQSIFFTVALSLTGSAKFFGDVEAQLDVTAADQLRDLAETYPALEEPFSVVRNEHSRDRHNPVTGLETTTAYHAEEALPLIRYTVKSGNVELYEGGESPEEVLGVATQFVRSTTDALEAAMDDDFSVNTEELSNLIDRREELESELDRLRSQIDELRRRPVGDE